MCNMFKRNHFIQMLVLPDEACNVDINKCGHEVLAVESVHDATVTWDSVGKILTRHKERL